MEFSEILQLKCNFDFNFNNLYFILCLCLLYFSENIIQKLDQQLFRSTSEGKHGQTLHLLTKKSVTQGVRKMYQEYINRKQEVIKRLSALIIQSLQEGVSTNITDLQQQNISVNQRDSDNLIVHVTEVCCESSRSV